jgi:hypothetical protein
MKNCVKTIQLKSGGYSKVEGSVGLNLTKLVQDILKINDIGACDPCPSDSIYLKPGTYRKGRKGKGLHLNRFIKDVLFECGVDIETCSDVCVRDYVLFDGQYAMQDKNKKRKTLRSLYLNEVIRDVIRKCGVRCIYCFEDPGFTAITPIQADSPLCGSMFVNSAAGDLIKYVIDSDGVFTETLVLENMSNFNDIAIAPNSTFYGNINGDLFTINTTSGLETNLNITGTISGEGLSMFNATEIISAGTSTGGIELYKYDVSTNTNTLWFTVPVSGTPAGDYIVIGNNLYISVYKGPETVNLVRAGLTTNLEWDNTFVDLGTLPFGTYFGLANVGENLYSVNGNQIVKINKNNLSDTTVVFTSTLASNFRGAASVEDGIVSC